MSDDPARRRDRRASTDPETIRRWADERDARPVRPSDSGPGDPQVALRPEAEIGAGDERIDWDEFFASLGDRAVAEGSSGLEVVDREAAADDRDRDRERGPTATSAVTETAVVERVVVEESQVESELVDTEYVDQRAVGVELLDREFTRCEPVDRPEADEVRWFDTRRYFDSLPDPDPGRPEGEAGSDAAVDLGGADAGADAADVTPESDLDPTADAPESSNADRGSGTETSDVEVSGADAPERNATPDAETASSGADELPTTRDAPEEPDRSGMGFVKPGAYRRGKSSPYYAALEVEERWAVTRSVTERYTVESRLDHPEIGEDETVTRRDVDVEELQRAIAGTDLLDPALSPDEILSRWDVETEFDEDAIYTRFDRKRVLRDEVLDRKRVRADVTASRSIGGETLRTDVVETEADETDEAEGEGEAGERDEASERVLTDDEIGKPVVDATGEQLGTVTSIEEGAPVMSVDGGGGGGIAQRIKSTLGWGDSGGETHRLDPDRIEAIDDDEIRLRE